MSHNAHRLSWIPDISTRQTEIYVALADALADDIKTGKLKAGHRLPPQRLLAYALNLNPGTVHKAYKLAMKRGLILGEVGRGSFVRGDAKTHLLWPNENPHDRAVDFCDNYPCPLRKVGLIQKHLSNLATKDDLSRLLQYQQNSARDDHKTVGASWIERFGVDASPQNTLITNGALHGGFISLLTLCRAGDTILTEELTSQAVKGAAQRLKLRLKGIRMDRDGIIPEHLEELLDKNTVSAVYLVPTVHNPTATVLSLKRRRLIASILAKRGTPLIEDDIFAPLMETPIRPLSSFIPQQSFYIAGLSKALAPALRLAFLKVPERFYGEALDNLRVTTWLASPLLMELAADLITSGDADRIIKEQRIEIGKRQKAAREALRGFNAHFNPCAPHLWLKLPEPWRAGQFQEVLRQKEVAVLASDSFAVEKGDPLHAIRLGLGTPSSFQQAKEGLDIIRATLLRGF